MPDYYFDTSALTKRYVVEVGSAWLTSLVSAAGNVAFTSEITPVELVAAVTRRSRGGTLIPAEAVAARQAIKSDAAAVHTLIKVAPAVIGQAIRLAEAHGLRGYDAIQLASALEANDRLVSSGLPPLTFICADQELNSVAVAEGLTVDDPNAHP